MPLKLPENSREMRDWEWNDYRPYFDYLSQQKIDSNNIEGWMKYWSRDYDVIIVHTPRLSNPV